jgi:fumarate hydratase subunit alpha
MEGALLKGINKLGIDVMSLGGNHTALAVHIDYVQRHLANYPVGIVFQSWAARRATITFTREGEYTIIQ